MTARTSKAKAKATDPAAPTPLVVDVQPDETSRQAVARKLTGPFMPKRLTQRSSWLGRGNPSSADPQDRSGSNFHASAVENMGASLSR